MKVIVIGGLQIEIVSNTQEGGYNYAHACLPQVLITWYKTLVKVNNKQISLSWENLYILRLSNEESRPRFPQSFCKVVNFDPLSNAVKQSEKYSSCCQIKLFGWNQFTFFHSDQILSDPLFVRFYFFVGKPVKRQCSWISLKTLVVYAKKYHVFP